MNEKREFLLERATQIAQIIVEEVTKINKQPFKEINLNNLVAFWEHANLSGPKIKEILIFGSLAKAEGSPNDIDIMLLDNGWFSDGYLLPDGTKDRYLELSEHLFVLLTDWFNMKGEALKILEGINVDLHILPFQMLYSEKVQKKWRKVHADPNFFTNAFSALLRFDIAKKEFILTNIEELSTKHRRKKSTGTKVA